MGSNNRQESTKKGFTIIEVVLFLGISSLLSVGLMVGWTVNINRQRYNDTVNTFKSNIQKVFSEVENIENGRTEKYKCNVETGSVTINQDGATGANRGASDCVSLGKMITFGACEPGSCAGITTPAYSSKYTTRDVIGLDIDTSSACGGTSCTNDIDAFRATQFVVSSSEGNDVENEQTFTLEWSGAQKARTDNTNNKFTGSILNGPNGLKLANTIYGLLILRSPMDGTVRTFAIPLDVNNPDSSIYTNKESQKYFREKAMGINTLMDNNKKIDFCVSPGGINSKGGADISGFGINKVIRIGNSSASVEIATTDGAGSLSCDGSAGIEK